MKQEKLSGIVRIQKFFKETFGLSPIVTALILILFAAVIAFSIVWFIISAPPSTVVMTSGPDGSVFQTNAERYKKLLAANGVKLVVLPSHGSRENLARLMSKKSSASVGFMQGGLPRGTKATNIVSLGTLYSEPLMLYYRGKEEKKLLSDFKGSRIAVGLEGSGTRALALSILGLNGITTNSNALLLDTDGEDAAQALISGDIDAVFMMGDSASYQTMRKLQRTAGIQIFNYTQADAYIRRMQSLTKLTLPMGSIDFGRNVPPHDITLIGTTVELVARDKLHSAICDILLEAAQEIHGRPGTYRKRGEFPSPLTNDLQLSENAARFYKSGKSFFYRHFPYWLATLISQLIVVVIPVIVLLIPGIQAIPAIYSLVIDLSIGRLYRALLTLEQEVIENPNLAKDASVTSRLEKIEEKIKGSRVPVGFAGQFYILRQHIEMVRTRITAGGKP
ncbi:MAG: ABC transporter substrate-binding protein [Spirochaetes bacterium]|nr:ABC transporter substrate-binding protein [Spirochaetota bacterium]